MLFALATGCVATAGGYVSTPQPVVTAQVDVGTPPPADPAPVADVDPPDDNQYDDDLYEGDAETIELNPNVRVVYGVDDAIFYSDGYYWRYGDDGTWYRSSVHTGGWAVYADIPVHIRTIERPVQYRRYRPATYTPRARKAGPRPAKSRPSYARPARNNNRPGNYNRNDNRPGNYNKAQPHKAEPHRNDNRPSNYNKAQPHAQPHKAEPARNDNRPSNYNKAQPKAEPKKAEPAPKKAPPPKKDDDYKKKKK
jgi:hypothetical protein